MNESTSSAVTDTIFRRRLNVLSGWMFLSIAVWLAAPSASAIPAFARRYNLPCYFCHDGYPRLGAVGESFRDLGFRLAQEETSVGEWLKSVPVILRTGANQTFVEDGDANTAGFFKVVSAGNVGPRFAYWIDQTWVWSEDGFDRFGTDNAWARLEILPEQLYVRAGRVELDLPFSQARTPHLFAYDIYFENTGFESDNIGGHQDGVEIGGVLDGDKHWSLAVVKGRNSSTAERLTDRADDFDANLYGRFVSRFDRNRLGALAYFGRNTLAREVPGASGPRKLVWDNDLFRIGADGSWYVGRLNLYGTYLYGRNSDPIADADRPEGTGEPLDYHGGFLQGAYFVGDNVSLNLRLNYARRPPGRTALPDEDFVGVFPGLIVWLESRIKLNLELGFQNRGRPTLGGLQAEIAF